MEDISSLSSATSSSPKITATLPMEVISTDARKLELLESRMSGKAVSDAITSIPPPQPSLVPAQDQVPETQVQANPNVEIEVVNRSSDSDDALRDMAVETNGTEGMALVHSLEDSSSTSNKPRKKRKNYTAVEDAKILEGVKKYGPESWSDIQKWGQFDRTPSQIKERYKRITKKTEEQQLQQQQQQQQQQPIKKRRISEEPGTGDTPEHKEEFQPFLSQMEKEKKELDELREKLRKKEQELSEREEQLKSFEKSLAQKDGSKVEKPDANKAANYKKVLIEILRDKSQLEKQVARSNLYRECHRLGQLRHGQTFVEVWQDGQIFKDLAKKHTAILEQREELEKMKRDLAKQIKKKIATDGSESSPELDELLQQQEICKVRLSNLKRDEAELNAEREKLNIQKNVHIRELKRIHDEDQSRFNDNRLLEQRYLLLNLLGKGGFSEVYKAFDLQEMRYVACKIHQLNSLWTDKKKENYIRHAVREYNIHKSVVHSKIVRLFDVFEIDENSFCTVLEFCNGLDLDLYLKTQTTLSEREAKSIVVQIFGALEYLSKQKRQIIHYDLKPGNILFHNGEVKVTDFGLSKVLEEDSHEVELTSQGAGTYWYLPPECFETGKDPPKISPKVDVWSAGVIFYQMLYGKKPFGNNLSQQKILADNVIASSVLEFPSKPVVSKEAKEFIGRCLSRSLHSRPDVSAAYSDPYLKITPKKKEKKNATNT